MEEALPSTSALNALRELRVELGLARSQHLLPCVLAAIPPSALAEAPEWAELLAGEDLGLLEDALLLLSGPTRREDGSLALGREARARPRLQKVLDAGLWALDDDLKRAGRAKRPRRYCLVDRVALLVALHETPAVAVPGAKLLRAIGHCIGECDVFGEQIVKVALDRMSQAPPTPLPFLRSCMLALKRHSALRDFMAFVVLARLAGREHLVWQEKSRWSGFIMLAEMLCEADGAPRAPAPSLLRLPLDAVRDLLDKKPQWKEHLAAFAANEWDLRHTMLTDDLKGLLGVQEVGAAPAEEGARAAADDVL